MHPATSFTGRSRARQTRLAVRWIDRIAGAVITVGGIGTIVAVLAVFVFLASVAWPLLLPARIGAEQRCDLPWASGCAHLEIADGGQRGWAWMPEAQELRLFDATTGQVLATEQPARERRISAAHFSDSGAVSVFGFEDGSIQFGSVAVGEEDRLEIQTQEPWPAIGDAAPIALVDRVQRGTLHIACFLDGRGRLTWRQSSDPVPVARANARDRVLEIAYPPHATGQPPRSMLLSELGDSIYLAWADGQLVRIHVQGAKAEVAEVVDVVDDPAGTLTSLTWLLGRNTLLVGDSQGNAAAWFVARPETAQQPPKLVRGHAFPHHDAPVARIESVRNSRAVAIAYEDGCVRLWHVTSGKRLGEIDVGSGDFIQQMAWSPRSDGLAILQGTHLSWNALDLRHPEVSLSSLFAPIWYEGFWQPAHAWQSTGSDQFEPKFGFWPLVFGTLKATFYAMLFAVPIALLAAIYTSEFMSPRVRSRVKPVVEMMASLPSVVLGFMAGLVVAPFVETHLLGVLAVVAAVPLSWMSGAYLWQLLPAAVTLRAGRARPLLILMAMATGAAVAWNLAPVLERRLFAGNLKLWLDGGPGFASTWGAWWSLALLPLAMIVGFGWVRLFNPHWRRWTTDWSRFACAAGELAKFLTAVLLTILGAAIVAGLCERGGWDPRGSLLGTYDQRNSLIVAFAMGFAVVPIIYTIAEDALASVPQHLRSAALGAGATPWQTATTVVIPTAMSGLFSAVMVGLGRAVGETMIVLMATGGTPVLDWNVFNGFRTLSATIAEEIPETDVGTTHYRLLFLAALMLFALTFVINFLAEWVRQRFRKRAYSL